MSSHVLWLHSTVSFTKKETFLLIGWDEIARVDYKLNQFISEVTFIRIRSTWNEVWRRFPACSLFFSLMIKLLQVKIWSHKQYKPVSCSMVVIELLLDVWSFKIWHTGETQKPQSNTVSVSQINRLITLFKDPKILVDTFTAKRTLVFTLFFFIVLKSKN